MRKPDRRAGRHQDNSGTLADRRLLHLTNRAGQREFGKLSNGRVRKDLDAREPFGKGKALGPCELRALLCDERSSRARSTAEGASDSVVGTFRPTTPATFDGKPNLLTTSLARQDRNCFRSLQGG